MSDIEIQELYAASYRRLLGQLIGVTGNVAEAEDVVQEAFVRGLDHPRRLLGADNPEAWLRTVAVNIARTRWRRRKLFDTLVRTGRVLRTPESVPGADPNRVALVAALQKLSRPTREAIVLHHLADLSVYEVAQALGVPVGTVKARLSRGRAILAKLLSELADEPARAESGQPVAGQPLAGLPLAGPPAAGGLPAGAGLSGAGGLSAGGLPVAGGLPAAGGLEAPARADAEPLPGVPAQRPAAPAVTVQAIPAQPAGPVPPVVRRHG